MYSAVKFKKLRAIDDDHVHIVSQQHRRETDKLRVSRHETSGKSHSIHQVVIVGGGFGGLSAARSLSGEPVHVTLIDRRNFHLFQPLLYQAATGQLSPADIASPLRAVVARQKNISVLENEVVDILPDEQRQYFHVQALKHGNMGVASTHQHQIFNYGILALHLGFDREQVNTEQLLIIQP